MNAVSHPMREKLSRETTELALTETALSPRFYTTDFAEVDKVDVSGVREEWDALIAEMESDPNRNHFKRTDERPVGGENRDWRSVCPRRRIRRRTRTPDGCSQRGRSARGTRSHGHSVGPTDPFAKPDRNSNAQVRVQRNR